MSYENYQPPPTCPDCKIDHAPSRWGCGGPMVFVFWERGSSDDMGVAAFEHRAEAQEFMGWIAHHFHTCSAAAPHFIVVNGHRLLPEPVQKVTAYRLDKTYPTERPPA